MANKDEIRAQFFAKRNKFSPKEIETANFALCANVEAFFSSRSTGLWAAYRAMPNEASIDAAFPLLGRRGLSFCFPRVVNAELGTMDFFLVEDWRSDFEQHPWGMWEPKQSCQIVTKEKILGAFIPLLAFDAKGTRLGKGRAFYDRYLENFHGKRVGLGFDWQFSANEIPRESHDIAMHAVITDKKIYRFSNQP